MNKFSSDVEAILTTWSRSIGINSEHLVAAHVKFLQS